jgi:hypothetical protein
MYIKILIRIIVLIKWLRELLSDKSKSDKPVAIKNDISFPNTTFVTRPIDTYIKKFLIAIKDIVIYIFFI